MNKRMQKSIAAALALMTLLASQSVLAEVCIIGECSAMTPEFRSAELRPATIALLPARSTLTENGVFNSESRVGETYELEKHLAISLEQQISSRGYEVRSLSIDEIAEDQQLSSLVNAANQRYDEEYTTIVAFKVDGVKYRRYSVGEESRMLANYLGVDAVAFPRMQIKGASSGSKWMSGLGIKQGAQAGINMEFGLVHARTGDVEAFYGGVTGGFGNPSFKKILKKAEKYMANIAKVATKKMPDIGEVLKADKLKDKEERRELVLYDPVDEEAVLGGLEDLLGDDDMFGEEESVPAADEAPTAELPPVVEQPPVAEQPPLPEETPTATE